MSQRHTISLEDIRRHPASVNIASSANADGRRKQLLLLVRHTEDGPELSYEIQWQNASTGGYNSAPDLASAVAIYNGADA